MIYLRKLNFYYSLSWIDYDRRYTYIRSFVFSSEKQNKMKQKKKNTRKYRKLNICMYNTQHLKSILHFAKVIPFVSWVTSVFLCVSVFKCKIVCSL